MLGNPNGLGIFCLLYFLLFYIIQDNFQGLFTNREKAIVYTLIALSLIMSGSRNSLVALMIFLFFSYFTRISPFIAIVAFTLMMLAYQYISNNIITVAQGLGLSDYFRVSTLQDASGRFIAWNFAMDNIKQSPWLGKGFEYTNYLYLVNEDYLSDLGHNGNAHNSYLTLWLDTGLLGGIAYLWAFFGSFIQAAKRTRLAVPLMLAVVFSTFFESWLTASLNPFTIQLLMILTILTSEEFFQRTTPATLLVQ
jgi:O-antigen ligase